MGMARSFGKPSGAPLPSLVGPEQVELTGTLKPRDQRPSALRRNINMASTRFLTLAFRMMLVM